MPCLNCGRPWDGSNAYCPQCGVRATHVADVAVVCPTEVERKLDAIMSSLHAITHLLASIEYNTRTRIGGKV